MTAALLLHRLDQVHVPAAEVTLTLYVDVCPATATVPAYVPNWLIGTRTTTDPDASVPATLVGPMTPGPDMPSWYAWSSCAGVVVIVTHTSLDVGLRCRYVAPLESVNVATGGSHV
jgi:hypothetical protein